MKLSNMKIGETINLSDNAHITRTLDGYLNETGSLVVRTEGAITPTIEEGLFSVKVHKAIVEFIRSEAFLAENDQNNFKRKGAHNLPFLYIYINS